MRNATMIETRIRRPTRIALIALGVFLLGPATVRAEGGRPQERHLPPGLAGEQPYAAEENLIEVMFARESRVRLRAGEPVDLEKGPVAGLAAFLQRVAWHEWWRACDTPEERIDELTERGEANTGRQLYNPNNLYRLRIGPGADVWDLSRDLEALPGIHLARPVPLPMMPPTPPDYEPQQGYLRPAGWSPTGIDADYAWTQPGGTGTGIIVCDLEYSWNWSHADVQWSYQVHLYIQDPFNDDNHGTAVLGVLGSRNNGWGTTGIAHGGTFYTCGTYFKPIGGQNYSWNVPGSIVDAASVLNPGDVILIEHQWDLTGTGGFVPIEWWTDTYPNQTYNAVYESIEWALAVKRVHVVEPAGNGAIDLDGLNWYGDSGAIIVGAGGAYPGGTWSEGDLQRLSFSSYGSRVDVQGWGEDVVTTGYGDLYNAEGTNYLYTSVFDGTSSAAPVVAGALASCAGYWMANVSARWPMHPAYARSILEATGTPQIMPPAGNIGPRPDLAAALPRLRDWVDVTASPLDQNGGAAAWGDYDDDGDLDVYISHGEYHSNKLLRNDGGGNFTDVTPEVLQLYTYSSAGAIWGDYDNDGDVDLYVPNDIGDNKMFRNDSGTFVDATSGPLGHPNLGTQPTWVDYDNDGDIDLYVAKYGGANKLLRNDGGGNFTDVTSGPEGDAGYTTYNAWVDHDNDGDLDVLLSDWQGTNKLLRNDGGIFVDVSAPPLCQGIHNGMSTWGDYDNDGDMDVYLVKPDWGDPNKLCRNDGGGVFTDVTPGLLADTQHCAQATWADADNDGYLDLYLINNQERNRLFRGQGSQTFIEDTHGLLVWEGYDTSNTWTDDDTDGDLDLYVSCDFPANSNTLARNNSTGANHWLQVRLQGTISSGTGIGSRVRIVTGRGVQIRDIQGGQTEQLQIACFGLGSLTLVDTLQVFWPDGTVQEAYGVVADQQMTFMQEGTSASPRAPAPPLAYRLHASAPSPLPAGRAALIRYDLRAPEAVRLGLYDMTGRLVRRLVEGTRQDAGSHPILWDGRDESGRRVASGVYIYRLEAGRFRACRRLVVLS